jgi:hypothetical protein
MHPSRLVRNTASVLARALWIPALFTLVSFISFVRPRLMRAATATAERPGSADPLMPQVSAITMRQRVGQSLGAGLALPDLPLPEPDDAIFFSHGIPVVPWLKRVGVRQWQIWLDQLAATLRARYPDRADIAPGAPWEAWVREHVRYVEVHFARLAAQRIARLVATLSEDRGAIYFFGHSAGGSAILQYLSDLREGSSPAPKQPIRAVLTLDAAVNGPARIWTGWPTAPERPGRLDHLIPKVRRYLTLDDGRMRWHRHISWARDYLQLPFRGLGTWAREHDTAVLTVSNLADAFSHPQLDDLPYMKMNIGRRFNLKDVATGRTHLCVQRDPRVPYYLWWHEDVPMSATIW